MSDLTDRRKHILAAAEKLLEHYGLTKTTVADIAREAAIGVGTVYLEFGSKDDIIEHLAGQKHAALLARLKEAAEGEASALDKLRALLDARVDAFLRYATCGTHAKELVHCRCKPVEMSWEDYVRKERALVAEVIETGCGTGEFDVADSDRAAATVLRAYTCFSPPWVFRDPATELRENLDAMHSLVLFGLVRRSAP